MALLYLSGFNMMEDNSANKTKDILGARMKIMWEEHFVDPLIAYIISVNVM